jgi:hypothetical protein
MLMVTVLTALHYLLSVIHDPSQMPSLPANLVTVVGGSQFMYLGLKARSFFPPQGQK